MLADVGEHVVGAPGPTDQGDRAQIERVDQRVEVILSSSLAVPFGGLFGPAGAPRIVIEATIA
jgi:hypothetical protein